jgi:hypothetical protein
MSNIGTATFIIALGSAICGTIASFYWYKASSVPDFFNATNYILPDGDLFPPNDLLIEHRKALHSLLWETKAAFANSASRNRKAALWTAVSVLLAGLSAVLNVWPNSN